MKKCFIIILSIGIAQLAQSIDVNTTTTSQKLQMVDERSGQFENHQKNEVSTMTGHMTEMTSDKTQSTWMMVTGENNSSNMGESKIRRDIPSDDERLEYQPEKADSTVYEEVAGNDEAGNATIESYDEYTTQKESEPRFARADETLSNQNEEKEHSEQSFAQNSTSSIFSSTLLYLAFMCFSTWIIYV